MPRAREVSIVVSWGVKLQPHPALFWPHQFCTHQKLQILQLCHRHHQGQQLTVFKLTPDVQVIQVQHCCQWRQGLRHMPV